MSEPDDWADQALRYPDALRTLEHDAIHTATLRLIAALETAQRTAANGWTAITATARDLPGADAIRQLITRIRQLLDAAFRGQAAHAQRTARDAATTAARLGATQAAATVGTITGTTPPNPPPQTSDTAQQAADAIPAAVDAEHHAALALLTTAALTAAGLAALAAVFNRARRAVSRIAAAVAVAVTSAAAAGSAAVARALGPRMLLLWVAEPDACPACAAYAGHTVPVGKKFPGGLSLDPRRTVFATPLYGPPRHIHCRCVVIPWRSDWQTTGTPLPQLLRKRARQTARRTA
ncbi:hypothetical protein [Streptomyces sp. H27-D2]|uniref:hypothetical protein n=1 Tax=Streptomyces sp. H27-D2 TaxID=3046304 RepID=UPI002DBEB9DF|nr:hypothetical protein [Streptomyces sp. H27-D2]MEC4016088.1 hypothetical protein [Streptomyces sp. H27-D2]